MEAEILRRAPSASLALAVLVASFGLGGGWLAHTALSSDILTAKDERIGGLKDEIDRLQKQIANLPPEPIDPDAIYQGGKKIGAIEKPDIDAGNGRYRFNLMRTAGNFNPSFVFIYRGVKLKIVGTPSFAKQRDGHGVSLQFFDVTTQAIDPN